MISILLGAAGPIYFLPVTNHLRLPLPLKRGGCHSSSSMISYLLKQNEQHRVRSIDKPLSRRVLGPKLTPYVAMGVGWQQ